MKRTRLTSNPSSINHVAPPALSEPGERRSCEMFKDWQTRLNKFRNLVGFEGQPADSCECPRFFSQASQFIASGWRLSTHCCAPIWWAFFGLAMRSTAKPLHSDNELAKLISPGRRLKISPGLSMPKNPTISRVAKTCHKTLSGPRLFCAKIRALHTMATSRGIGRGGLKFEGLCSSQDFMLFHAVWRLLRRRGLVICTMSTACLAKRRLDLLSFECICLMYCSSISSTLFAFSRLIMVQSSPASCRKASRERPPSNKRRW